MPKNSLFKKLLLSFIFLSFCSCLTPKISGLELQKQIEHKEQVNIEKRRTLDEQIEQNPDAPQSQVEEILKNLKKGDVLLTLSKGLPPHSEAWQWENETQAEQVPLSSSSSSEISPQKINLQDQSEWIKNFSRLTLLRANKTEAQSHLHPHLLGDPHWEILFDWRDPSTIRSLRQNEAIELKIKEWQTQLGYTFYGKAKKQPEWIYTLLAQKLSTYPTTQIQTQAQTKEASPNSSSPLSKVSTVIPFSKLTQLLEKIREEDFLLYQNRRTKNQSKIHPYFRTSPEWLIEQERKRIYPKDEGTGETFPAVEN